MAHGVEWVEPSPGREEVPRAPEDVEEQLGELRDQIRRLQEQVNALAARSKEARGRVRTYIQGLDELLQGGIPSGHVVLISGPVGSMKTSLALYTLMKNRAAGLRGLYVTVEEGRESILATMRNLGLGTAEDFIVDIGRLRMDHAGAEAVRDWMQVLREYLTRRRERDEIGLVVIDSLNALAALAQVQDMRGDLLHFFNFLRSLVVTSLIVLEQDASRPGVADPLADGVLELRFSGAGEGKVQLLVRCSKMRQTNHSRDYLVLTHDGGKFVAKPYETPRPPRRGFFG